MNLTLVILAVVCGFLPAVVLSVLSVWFPASDKPLVVFVDRFIAVCFFLAGCVALLHAFHLLSFV